MVKTLASNGRLSYCARASVKKTQFLYTYMSIVSILRIGQTYFLKLRFKRFKKVNLGTYNVKSTGQIASEK